MEFLYCKSNYLLLFSPQFSCVLCELLFTSSLEWSFRNKFLAYPRSVSVSHYKWDANKIKADTKLWRTGLSCYHSQIRCLQIFVKYLQRIVWRLCLKVNQDVFRKSCSSAHVWVCPCIKLRYLFQWILDPCHIGTFFYFLQLWTFYSSIPHLSFSTYSSSSTSLLIPLSLCFLLCSFVPLLPNHDPLSPWLCKLSVQPADNSYHSYVRGERKEANENSWRTHRRRARETQM